jgi:adenosylcobinamide-GDP ribazoletransferase
MRSLLAAFRFLTRIPLPGPETQAADLAPAVGWFPLVGGVVGAGTAGLFVLALRFWPAPIAAVLAVGFGMMLTGGFHEDGFTDAVDGLGGGYTRERVLEIMKDSRIGAYGAMALWCMLTLRWASLCALDRRALVVLPLAMIWGRASISWTLLLLPSISQGLAKEVHRNLGLGSFILSSGLLILAMLGAWFLHTPHLLRAALAAFAVAGLWMLYLRRRMGGHSGDLLGAGNQLVEAAVLLALMAR